MTYCIIETDDGWTVAEIPEGSSAKDVAVHRGAVLIDSGPYQSYEEASDALVALQRELDADEVSDIPGTRAVEGRYDAED